MNALRIQNVPSVDLYCGNVIFRPDRDQEQSIKVEHHLTFPMLQEDGTENENCCLAFPCDESGFVDLGSLTAPALANLKAALTVGVVNGRRFAPGRIERREFRCSYRERSWLLCDCGAAVHLTSFTNTCHQCAADYNMSGSQLAPRSQWGEETGETVADILRADCAPDED